ncbi:MAG: DegV family protein [Cellulosilyticaceae bacterium]
MKKIALITDSASDLPQEVQEKYDVFMLHFQIVYPDMTYKDQVEITSKEVLAAIEEKRPTTSLPALEEIHQTFEQIKAQGYEKVLAITISSGLSGCHNAVQMVADEYSDLSSHIYDSRTISLGETCLVQKAGELIEAGYEDLEEIVKVLDGVRSRQHIFFMVDTLKYLVAGGRIGRVSGMLGGVLNLKPIITVADDGVYVTQSKVRGTQKALAKVVEEAKGILDVHKCKVYMIHGDGEKGTKHIYDLLKEESNIEEIGMYDWISPVACVHTGPGFIGLLLQEV